jgi:quinol monooxygenase YgiN
MSLLHPDATSAQSGHINVVAQTYAKPGKEDEVRQLMMGIAEAARKEDGCKGYHLLEAKHAPGTFFTYEEWTGEDVLKTHLEGATRKMAAAQDLFAQAPQPPTVFEHLL